MEHILILHDNQGYIATSLATDSGYSINKQLLQRSFEEKGYYVEIKNLHELRFPSKYQGWYVIYPSSEDPGLFYKSFIEDILLRLKLDGAILLPEFYLFRAHHNKVFMELCRTKLSEEYNTLRAFPFYSSDDLKSLLKAENLSYPVVIKSSAGAGSVGVRLAHNKSELLKKAREMGRISYTGICHTNRMKIRRWLGCFKRKILGIKALSKINPREKLVIQSFIPKLSHDYKVLVFGEKYYILKRTVRSGDFRASGSGKLEFPVPITETELKVLDFAKGAYEQLNAPLLSIDIAYDGSKCHMVEFQCLNFGPYTLQFSSRYYIKNEKWTEVIGQSILEEEMAAAIDRFIRSPKV